ncbi:hypothetical protein A3K34_01395 [candidate division WWE3 bacterium RIFOXYC1_FULL_40_10]|uniref:phenylalanine--tRNA ligase n=1 Tax=candidate division WWE3 bacterium RIFOXYA2_FULL_46_9 TaxID=1802636 RepID=A0A1F4W3H7_UNCKA|nr:MAG: hypothetical protein A3K58_01395 [candidate division WWE3 bacterium RIFOXYB1_FULL_40_22]OGC61525.1 MAG: hypothetical protein A3K37_01395 [candidate division WWE3 bacterium RIFOXYA1_FULL_40_11]OGC63573.1 MAG: hypothetical protein A2264_04335 [candidate division WWE3 bacterium RIFOXYA2_FULL_46_9]OGC64796.1 MAG: hypothetical protein A2326_02060 [candidate division WWE3 bacterium RIFOXYB2_FULL_41_6]OGC65908.1 MAG: hypothetical protein A3K34_01395 [candidate division WWE3 bacterium RIFOXYC1_
MKIPIEWLKEYVQTDKSPKEIADSFTALGLLLDKPIYEYKNDGYETSVLDLEHRMDRSDWLSIIGCARDFAAFENSELKLPSQTRTECRKQGNDTKVEIKVECPDLVNRFYTRVFTDLKVGPSPIWLKNRLEAYGIPSINNVVDITNYVMVETGQPMHAQDIDKMEKPEIIIRRARQGESVVTLLGETVKLDESAFVLTQNDKPTVIGGIVGGAGTGVDEATTKIVLDAGNYNQTNIRKTSRKLKIQNETVLRYDKYLHPELAKIAIERASQLILELAGGTCFDNEDWYENPLGYKQLDFTYSRLEKVSGMLIHLDKIDSILSKLGYKVIEKTNEGLKLEIPYYRTDIEVEDDIIADVLRINNYANIPTAIVPFTPPSEITPAIYIFEEKLRDILVNLGLHGFITDPLVKTDDRKDSQVLLENALSSEKGAMRTSLFETLEPVILEYKKHKQDSVKLYELGRVYNTSSVGSRNYSDYSEIRKVCGVFWEKDKTPYEISKITKEILSGLLFNLGITSYSVENKNLLINGNEAGVIKYNGFELNTESLIANQALPTRILTSYDSESEKDFTFNIPVSKEFGEILEQIKNSSNSINRVEIIGEYRKSNEEKAITVRVYYTGEIDSKEIQNIG